MDSEPKLDWKSYGGWIGCSIDDRHEAAIEEAELPISPIQSPPLPTIYQLFFVDIGRTPWTIGGTYDSLEEAKADAYRQYVIWRLSYGL